MIYLQFCCFCVDLRIGSIIIGVLDFILDIIATIFIAIFGESGIPDLCHKLFLVFMIIHMISIIFLIIGAIKLRPKYMLCYVLVSLIKLPLMIILLIADIILRIWYPVLLFYIIMFVVGLYFWLVVYSFYAAVGGQIFM
ncbi:uncharacterized protein LOC115624693 [Scaptodrosophila lebanonensis]|uniref:Uncharacterized protein LOC115624693 n=1 Tax=Drosophila lebanonensis TaxID=7225 RepID=A0A6J2TF35_DROLE|nr:uncharacterized protein LOC115624693 [Scaptodrosophila lebanonensis]